VNGPGQSDKRRGVEPLRDDTPQGDVPAAVWRPIAAFAAIGAIALGAVSSFDFSTDELVGDAFGPVAIVGLSDTDDGAGDTQTASEADRYFPVPAPLEDERVVAAIGPIAQLACTRAEYGPPAERPPAAAPPSDLGPPLLETEVPRWLDQNAAATAMNPLTGVPDVAERDDTAAEARDRALAAPSAPSESDAEHLFTDHLFAAALSPLALLYTPAPDDPPAIPVVPATEATTHASAPGGPHPAASAPENVVPPSLPAQDVPAAAGAAALDPVALAPASAECPALLRHTFNRLQTGEPQSLCQFQGKVLLIVNTASYCGYTKQYEGLEAMYRKYRDRGLVVVGFPSNEFGGQEPGSNKEIAEFCRTTYGVEFPMFEKSSVTAIDSNPLYSDLKAKTGSVPRWNFHKYVVDRTGTRITSFASDVAPDARNFVDLIERLLAEKPAAGKG